MKKCPKCGAVQGDDRTTCIDCGQLLGRPLSEAEAERAEEELSDALYTMSERTDIFCVSPLNRVLGILSLLGAAALIALLYRLGGMDSSTQDENAVFALFGIPAFGAAALVFLFPRTLWQLETWRYRHWYGGEPSPTMTVAAVYAVLRYTLFVLGCVLLAVTAIRVL